MFTFCVIFIHRGKVFVLRGIMIGRSKFIDQSQGGYYLGNKGALFPIFCKGSEMPGNIPESVPRETASLPIVNIVMICASKCCHHEKL